MSHSVDTPKTLSVQVLLLVGAMPLFVFGQMIPSSPCWKSRIAFPDDSFRVAGSSAGAPGWVKFTLLLEPYDPNVVYFQDGHAYTFHHQFAVELLEPFTGMTPEQFNQATLFQEGRKAVLGAIILPPTGRSPPPPAFPEYGIQFVGRDPFSREEIAEMFKVIKASISADPGVQAFYFPAYEQLATAEANRDWFEAQDIPVSSSSRWAEGNTCYAYGWALGELKYAEGNNIGYAFRAGLLEPGDILITDGVPAKIPFVAGIISLSPSTPNSHVAILAQTFGIPFVHMAVAEDASRAQQLIGHRIVLRAFETFGGNDVRLIDVEGVLDEATNAEILALKAAPALSIAPMTHYGSYSAPTDGLVPADIKHFGGKAANFGILRRSVPDNSPVSLAFSFDLWNEYMEQRLVGGRTLREEINTRFARHTYPPADMAALSADLNDIRSMFRNTNITAFTRAQRNAVISILRDPQYGFDAHRKIRFRSSTNIEDANQFPGAGLYDSYSACLADDLDGDDQGPCICDPNRAGERGVFRAIRRVFASFYNDSAFLERIRHGINEAEVGMALLVHHSFPDEIELANGVATLEKWFGSNWDIKLVTQMGASSVTNPTDGSIPEEVNVYYYSSWLPPMLIRSSNLVPFGATVMDWQDDYIELSKLLITVAERFSQVTGKDYYLLDLEYKQVAPNGELVIKQVREIPRRDNTSSITPFLINEPAQYCTFQGEFGDVFANHRLKSRWRFETKSLWLTEDNLADSFFTTVTLEYLASPRVRHVSGMLPLWPKAFHTFDGAHTVDGWFMHDLPNPRACELHIARIPTRTKASENPMLTMLDFEWPVLRVKYDRQVPSWDSTVPTTTATGEMRLCPCPQPQPGDLLQHRKFDGPNDVSITTSFYWPPDPGSVGGYTAPLIRWVETVIDGYTTEPIVLRDWYAQTYRPEHHNFDEHFIFEPQLEPEISDDILTELRMHDIRMIHVFGGMSPTEITIFGYDEEPLLPANLGP